MGGIRIFHLPYRKLSDMIGTMPEIPRPEEHRDAENLKH